jgi:hypothetical protein
MHDCLGTGELGVARAGGDGPEYAAMMGRQRSA